MKEIDLHDITYEFVVNVTKLFLMKYRDGEITLDKLVSIVKSIVPSLLRFDYTFDESIWPPMEPELYENLIEFRAQLRRGDGSYLPFRLYVKKNYDQQPTLLIPGTFMWNNYGKDARMGEDLPS